MKLESLGYNQILEKYKKEHNLDDFEIGRIVAEHKERYIVKSEQGNFDAEITGNMRFAASGREDFPAVGDWVAFMTFGPDQAIIHQIFPRSSVLSRQAVGQKGELQIIATNIDFAFLVQAADRDFNINRLERYLTICYSAKVNPVIVLSKIDLINNERVLEIQEYVKSRIKDVPLLTISNENLNGIEELKGIMEKGMSYCMLGSSGVGKSTLLNNLSGKEIMKTDHISESTNKGRHITSHRELIILENGSILIDTPGMREVGISDDLEGLQNTFDRIIELSENCRFKDCTHISETGCAVQNALDTGELDRDSYENYIKLEREKTHFESDIAERRKKDKDFGKMVKNFKKLKYGERE